MFIEYLRKTCLFDSIIKQQAWDGNYLRDLSVEGKKHEWMTSFWMNCLLFTIIYDSATLHTLMSLFIYHSIRSHDQDSRYEHICLG